MGGSVDPYRVPNWADQMVYIVENDFGRGGRVCRNGSEYADLEATIPACWKASIAIQSAS